MFTSLVNYIIFSLLLLLSIVNSYANDRIALVIGNSNYNDLGTLKNTPNDARAMGNSLKELGYKVTLILDASEGDMRKSVRKFSSDSDKSSLALVFYAGHGAQVNGENYLLPVDMEIPKTESDIQLQGFKVDDLINSLRSKTKVVFLDACRDNPALIKNLAKGRGSYRGGLAPAKTGSIEDQSSGIFIAYATDSGNVALDGEGQKNSPFTSALLKYIKSPVSIDDMFSMVTKDVRQNTKNNQTHPTHASLDGVVCLPLSCGSVNLSNIQEVVKSENLGIDLIGAKWVLVTSGILTNALIYIDPSSIIIKKDRNLVSTKWVPENLNHESLKPYLNIRYNLSDYAYDCNSKKFALYRLRVFNTNNELILDEQYDLPENILLDKNLAEKGTVAEQLEWFLCHIENMKPMMSPSDFNGASWTRINTLLGGISENYYLKSSVKLKDNLVEVIAGIKLKKASKIHEMETSPGVFWTEEPFMNSRSGPLVKFIVLKNILDCQKNKGKVINTQLYAEDGSLVRATAASIFINDLVFSDINPETTFDKLLRVACN